MSNSSYYLEIADCAADLKELLTGKKAAVTRTVEQLQAENLHLRRMLWSAVEAAGGLVVIEPDRFDYRARRLEAWITEDDAIEMHVHDPNAMITPTTRH